MLRSRGLALIQAIGSGRAILPVQSGIGSVAAQAGQDSGGRLGVVDFCCSRYQMRSQTARPSRLSLKLLLAVLFLSVGAIAQKPDVDPESGEESAADGAVQGAEGDQGPPSIFYDTATVEARPIEKATATVSVVEEDEIEALEAAHVGDLLPWIPGLLVSGPASRAGLTTARIRGGDPNFTLVLVDGVPLNDSTDPLGGAFNLASLPIAGVERVEVVRGPLSTYFGSTGLSGAVNVITRTGAEKRFDVDLQAGSNSLLRSSVAFALPGDSVDSSFAASWEQEEGVIGEDRFEQLALVGGFQVHPSERTQLDLRARFASWEGDDYPDSSGGPVYGSGQLRQSQYDELSLGADVRLGAEAHRRHHRGRASLFRRSSDRQSPAILPIVPASSEESTYSDIQLAWTSVLPLTQKVGLNVGANLEREEGANESLLFLLPELGGELFGDYQIDRTTAGALVELTGEMGNWHFEIGTRLDLPSGESNEWSPRFGFNFRPGGSSVLLRGSIGEAFKRPSFYALASPPALGGNAELEPETALGADLGIEAGFANDAVELGLTLFAIDYDNLIDFDFETFSLINRSSVKARGLETSLSWRPLTTLVVRLELTLQDVEDAASAEELLQEPSWFGGFRIEWRPRRRLSLLLDTRGVAENLDRQIPVPERTKIEGYGVVGLAGRWQFERRWAIHFRLDNLTDEEYETQIGFPGVGRRLRLGVRYSHF